MDSVRILKMHAKGGFSTLVDYIMRTTIIMRDYGYIWLAQIDLATPDPLQLPPLGLPLLHHTPAEVKKDSCVENYLNFHIFIIQNTCPDLCFQMYNLMFYILQWNEIQTDHKQQRKDEDEEAESRKVAFLHQLDIYILFDSYNHKLVSKKWRLCTAHIILAFTFNKELIYLRKGLILSKL